MTSLRTGGQILVDQLVAHGVQQLFCVPGESFLAVLDGSNAMKAAVRHKFQRDNALDFALDEISVSAGAKQVIFNALMASLEPGDEVILPAPYWTSYADIVQICGGVPVVLPCSEGHGFRLEAGQLDAAITPRTRWVFLNSPSNPSGTAYSAAQLQSLAEVLLRHPQVWVLTEDGHDVDWLCTTAMAATRSRGPAP